VRIGVSFKPMAPASEIVRMARLAEANGIGNVWIGESPILWQELYSTLASIGCQTTSIHLGTFVTNPAIRDLTLTASAVATVNDISEGRVEFGIGTGDSALRMMGRSPVRVSELESAITFLKALWSGEAREHNGKTVQLKWIDRPRPAIWVAGMGPRVLHLAGRIADGVILSPADPSVLEWCLASVREGAESVGRPMDDIKVLCTAAVCIDRDIRAARDHVRWFPAVVANHVADVIRHGGGGGVPESVKAYLLPPGIYDWQRHGRKDATHNAYIEDELVDRACLIGPPEAIVTKLHELSAIGVDQVVAQTADWEDAEHAITALGIDVIPRLS